MVVEQKSLFPAIPDVKLNGMHLEQLKSHGLCLVYCLIMTNIGAMMISDDILLVMYAVNTEST